MRVVVGESGFRALLEGVNAYVELYCKWITFRFLVYLSALESACESSLFLSIWWI
jgi:hypothetical protein